MRVDINPSDVCSVTRIPGESVFGGLYSESKEYGNNYSVRGIVQVLDLHALILLNDSQSDWLVIS